MFYTRNLNSGFNYTIRNAINQVWGGAPGNGNPPLLFCPIIPATPDNLRPVHVGQGAHVGLVLLRRGDDERLFLRLLAGNALLFSQKVNQVFDQPFAGGDVAGDQDGERLDLAIARVLVLSMMWQQW